MNILQYNIQDGCREADRYTKLSTWIKELNVDVVTFNELNGWDSSEFYNEMVKLGFLHTHLFEMESSPYYVGVASRFPIELIEAIEEEPIYHGLLHVKINNVHFFIAHLTPFESTNREKETRKIVELANAIDEPIIVIGDLNTLSRHDKEHYEKDNTYDRLAQNDILARQHLLNNQINFSPMEILLEAGFSDLCDTEEFHHTMPTKIKEDHFDTGIYLRIDYILGNKHVLKYRPEAKVIQDVEVNKLSDHYPVLCKLSSI